MDPLDNKQSIEKISRDLQSSFKKNLRDYTETILFLLLLAIVVRTFFIGSYKVASDELSPTLMHGDYVLGFKLPAGVPIPLTSKKLGDMSMQSGDLVIFRCGPSDKERCVKRLIGLPGDRLEARDKDIYKNDRLFLKGAANLLKNAGEVIPPGKAQILGHPEYIDFAAFEAKAILIWFSSGYNQQSQDFEPRWSRIGNRLR